MDLLGIEPRTTPMIDGMLREYYTIKPQARYEASLHTSLYKGSKPKGLHFYFIRATSACTNFFTGSNLEPGIRNFSPMQVSC